MRRLISVGLVLGLLGFALYVGRERQRATEPPPLSPGPVIHASVETPEPTDAEPEPKTEAASEAPPKAASEAPPEAALSEVEGAELPEGTATPVGDESAASPGALASPMSPDEAKPDEPPAAEVTPEAADAFEALSQSDDPALALVRAFYEFLNEGETEAAYALVGQDWRDFMTFDEFSRLYQNTKGVRFLGVEVLEQTDERTTVGVTAEVSLAGLELPTTWRLYFTVAEEEGELRLLAPQGQLFGPAAHDT